jgi:hypothetical protein
MGIGNFQSNDFYPDSVGFVDCVDRVAYVDRAFPAV